MRRAPPFICVCVATSRVLDNPRAFVDELVRSLCVLRHFAVISFAALRLRCSREWRLALGLIHFVLGKQRLLPIP